MMALTALKSGKSCNTEQLLFNCLCREHAGYDGLNSAVIKATFCTRVEAHLALVMFGSHSILNGR